MAGCGPSLKARPVVPGDAGGDASPGTGGEKRGGSGTRSRQGHAAIGDQGTSPWLFPGGQPGRPISAFRMAERLRQLGILYGQARSAALFQLATGVPAADLARLLGIHIAVAVAWQRASAGDWTSYAAEISRRRNEPPNDTAR